jgi:hypothetical protein
MRLDEIQSWLWGVLRGEGAAQADRWVQGSPHFSAQAQVAWYEQMTLSRHLDALRAEFPALATLLGSRFAGIALDYRLRYPTKHPSLSQFGERLPAFLREIGEPAPAALAELEGARARAFLAADGVVAPLESLMAVPPEVFALGRLEVTPSLQCLQLDFDPIPTWRQQQETKPLVSPAPGATFLVVWRKGEQVFHNQLRLAEAEALRRASQGASLGEVCEAFGEDEEAVPMVFEALASWFNEEMIAAVRLPAA